MQILARQLADKGIRQESREIRTSNLGEQLSAVVMNSWTPAVPISRIGDHGLTIDPAFAVLLRGAYEAEEPVRI